MKKFLILISLIFAISTMSIYAKYYNINRNMPSKIIGNWKGINENREKFQLIIRSNGTIQFANKNSKSISYKKAVLMETDYDGRYGSQIFVKFYQKKLKRYKKKFTIRESHTWKFSFLGDFLYLEDIYNKFIGSKREVIKEKYILIKDKK